MTEYDFSMFDKPQKKKPEYDFSMFEEPKIVQPVQPMVPTLPKFETNEFNRDIPLMGRAKVIDETKPEIQFATDDISETPLPSPAQTVVEKPENLIGQKAISANIATGELETQPIFKVEGVDVKADKPVLTKRDRNLHQWKLDIIESADNDILTEEFRKDPEDQNYDLDAIFDATGMDEVMELREQIKAVDTGAFKSQKEVDEYNNQIDELNIKIGETNQKNLGELLKENMTSNNPQFISNLVDMMEKNTAEKYPFLPQPTEELTPIQKLKYEKFTAGLDKIPEGKTMGNLPGFWQDIMDAIYTGIFNQGAGAGKHMVNTYDVLGGLGNIAIGGEYNKFAEERRESGWWNPVNWVENGTEYLSELAEDFDPARKKFTKSVAQYLAAGETKKAGEMFVLQSFTQMPQYAMIASIGFLTSMPTIATWVLGAIASGGKKLELEKKIEAGEIDSTEFNQHLHSFSSGLLEIVTETFGSERIMRSALSGAKGETFVSGISQIIRNFLFRDGLSEGAEEIVAGMGNDALDILYKTIPNMEVKDIPKYIWNNMPEHLVEGAQGYVGGLTLGSGGAVGSAVHLSKYKTQVLETAKLIKRLKDIGRTEEAAKWEKNLRDNVGNISKVMTTKEFNDILKYRKGIAPEGSIEKSVEQLESYSKNLETALLEGNEEDITLYRDLSKGIINDLKISSKEKTKILDTLDKDVEIKDYIYHINKIRDKEGQDLYGKEKVAKEAAKVAKESSEQKKALAPIQIAILENTIESIKAEKYLPEDLKKTTIAAYEKTIEGLKKVKEEVSLDEETKVTEDKQKELKDEKETSKKRTRTEEKDTDLQKPTESKKGKEQALVEEEKPTKKKKVKKTVDKNPKNDSFSETQKYTLDGGKLEIAKRKGYDRFGVIELLVDKDSRRQGIATKLLQKAIDDHSRNLVSQVSNDASIDVHYKLGFRAYENGQSGRELSLGETKEARKEPSSIMMVSPKAQATTDGKPKPVDVVKEGKGKEVLTAEQLLKLPETERRLLDTTDDKGDIDERFKDTTRRDTAYRLQIEPDLTALKIGAKKLGINISQAQIVENPKITNEMHLANAIAEQITGKPIVWVKKFGRQSGSQYHGRIWADINDKDSSIKTTLHETIHQATRHNKKGMLGVYDVIIEEIIKEGRTEEEVLNTYREMKYPEQSLKEEVVAYYIGNKYNEEGFWTKLAEHSPQFVKDMITEIKKLINDFKLIFKFEKKDIVTKMLTSLEAQERIMSKAAEFIGEHFEVQEKKARTEEEIPYLMAKAYKDPFFSHLARIVIEKFPAKMKVLQVRNWLIKNGVKPVELDWSRVMEAVEEYSENKEITREMMLEAVQQQEPKLIEKILGEKVTAPAEYKKIEDLYSEEIKYIESFGAEYVPYEELFDVFDGADTFILSHFPVFRVDGDFVSESGDLAEMIQDNHPDANREEIIETMEDIYIAAQRQSEDTQHSTFQLKGEKKDYKELIMTAEPQTLNGIAFSTAMERIKIDLENDVMSQLEYDETIKMLEKQYGIYWAPQGHFPDIPNIVAHIRFNTRMINGKAVMFVEEIQSDWASDIRKKGLFATKEDYQKIAGSFYKFEAEMHKKYNVPHSDITEHMDKVETKEYSQLKNNLESHSIGGVYPTPYTGTAWEILTAKRILRYAVENGFDAVSWTTGKQQIDRWTDALRMTVDKIEWNKLGDKIIIDATKEGLSKFKRSFPADGTPIQVEGYGDVTIPDAIGGKMAKQILESEKRSGEFEGDNLSIGGRGFKDIYDERLGKNLTKLTKRLGGKVERTKLQELDIVVKKTLEVQFGGWGVYINDNLTGGVYESEEKANAKKDELLKSDEQQIFTITPEMSDPVMEGLPMFKRKENNTDKGIKTKDLNEGLYPFVEAIAGTQTKDTSMDGYIINGKKLYNKDAPELDIILEEISDSDPYVFKKIEDQDGKFDTGEFISKFGLEYDKVWNDQNQHKETEEESNILEQAQKYQDLMDKLKDVKHGNIPKEFRKFIKSVKLPSRAKASRLFGLLGNKNTSIPLFEDIYEQWVKDGVTSIFEPYAGAFTLGTHALTKAINAGLKSYHANVFDKEKYMIINAIKEGKEVEIAELLNKAIEQFTIKIYKESAKQPIVQKAFTEFTKKYPDSFVGGNDWLKFTLYDTNIGADAVNYPDVYEAFREVFQTVMNEFAIDRTDIKSLDDAVKIAFSNVIGVFSGKGQSMIGSNGFKSFENIVYHPKYGMIAAINQTADMMKLAKEKGTEINIYTEDGADFINRIDGYDNANTGIYLDPPYIKSALSTYKDQSIEDKDLLNKFMIPEEFINTHKKALLAARDEGARIALTNDSNYAYMKALQDELGDPSIFKYKEGSTPTSLITDKATGPISQEYFDKAKTQTTAGTTAVIEDPEVTAEKTRIRRLIHITAKMRGIVKPDKKTSAALEKITKRITGHDDMSGKNNKLDISIEQYKKILKAVKVKRPPKSGGKIVIMETTERKIQELKSHLISKGRMTQKHFKDIVKAVTGNDTFFEPRWIHRHKFVTNAHGRQILKGMIDASNMIAREIKINEALKNNSVIDDKIKKSIRILSKKYANEELNNATSEPKKLPNVTGWTKKFMDMRYLTNLMEKVTGLPFGRVHMELINARHEADKIIHKTIGDMHADIPMVIFKDIVNSEASLMRIEKEVASKLPKYMDKVPEADPSITKYEKQIADYITKILQKMEADVRFLRFMEFYNQHYQELYPKSKKAKNISNQSLNLLKKELIPNAPNEAINEAVNILETKGIDALRIWLDKQTWGVIATGYDIGEAASKTFSKKAVREAMSKTITKGHLKARQTVEYQDKEINIIQRFSSYVRQMVYNTELISELNTWSNMLVANIDKFDNSKYLMKGLYDNIEQIHGRGPHPERWFENFIVNAYSQASRAIFLDLEKPFRNLEQNIAMHRGIVKDSIGMRKLTKADREFYDTHVTQLKAIALDQLYRQYKGWGRLPGIKQLNIISDKANTIGRSDDFNRMWDFRMVMGRIYKAIKKHPQYMNTTTELNAMLKASGYGDITSIERIHGLQILATDGELAFSHYLSAQIVKKDHFQYERHLRSIEEQGSLTRELASNLLTFPKGYIQRQFLDIAKLTKIEREVGKDIGAAKTAAQSILWSAFIGSMIASAMFKFVTGADDEPYSVKNIALRMSIGGIALSAYQDAINFGSDIVNASVGDPWALKRLEKAPHFFNEFIPMYKILIDMLEAVTGTKRIDFLGTRQILGGAKGITIIDVIFYTKENDRYLTEKQIKMIKKYRIKRGFRRAAQHFLFGNDPPTIVDRIDEAVKDIKKHGMNRWEKLYWKAETRTAVDLDYIDRDERDKLIRKLERADNTFEKGE